MQASTAEAIVLQIAELQARLLTVSPIKPGDRVAFADADGTTYYGTVHALGRGRDGAAVAGLRMAGSAWLHAEPLVNLRRVCGECADCKAMNCGPRCLQ